MTTIHLSYRFLSPSATALCGTTGTYCMSLGWWFTSQMWMVSAANAWNVSIPSTSGGCNLKNTPAFPYIILHIVLSLAVLVSLDIPDSVRERFFWFMDVQSSLLHLPKPQSKHTFIFKATTHKTKKQQIICFLVYGCANASLNKFLFARAKTPIQTHFHLHSCYPQTKNVPPRVQKQNCTNWMFCTVHVQRTHSASYSARPQNAVNTMGLEFFGQFTLKNKHIVFFVLSHHFALCVHRAKHDVCAPLYFHQQNAAILLLEAWRHILH